MLKIFFKKILKNIILIHFQVNNTLKNAIARNRYYISKNYQN
jgi:hypothetical protein